MNRKTLFSTLLGIIGIIGIIGLSLVGCGGSTGATLGLNTNPRIRMTDLITTPGTTAMLIDNQNIDANATFGFTSGYNIFPNANHTVQFLAAATSASLINISPLFTLNEYATVVGYNTTSNTYASMLLSDVPPNIDNNVRIRVVNADSALGPVDIYVVLAGQSYASSPPTASNVQVGDTSQPYTIESPGSGDYTIVATAPGAKTALATFTTTTPITAGQSQTFVLANGSGGATFVAIPAYQY